MNKGIALPATLISVELDGQDLAVLAVQDDCLQLESADELGSTGELVIHLFDFDLYDYCTYTFPDVSLESSCKKEFSFQSKIRLSQHDSDFQKKLLKLSKIVEQAADLSNSVEDFNNLIDGQPLYPKAQDKTFYTSTLQRDQDWFSLDLSRYHELPPTDCLLDNSEYAFCLETDFKYRAFLSKDAQQLFADWLSRRGLENHPLFNRGFNRIYLGNEFCFNLLPSPQLAQECLCKAMTENLDVTLVFPFIREDQVTKMEKWITTLVDWSQSQERPVEIVVNDWGMLGYLQSRTTSCKPVLGRLLNKKQKDVKSGWKWGQARYQEEFLSNNTSLACYLHFLGQNKVCRMEFDMPNIYESDSSIRKSYHFPYFQTNTSQYCALAAECLYKNRSVQLASPSCTHFCEHFTYTFPQHLPLTGKGNTLFGFDERLLVSPQFFKRLCNAGYDRFVYSQFEESPR